MEHSLHNQSPEPPSTELYDSEPSQGGMMNFSPNERVEEYNPGGQQQTEINRSWAVEHVRTEMAMPGVPEQSKGPPLSAATSAADEVDFRNAYYPSLPPMYWEVQENTRGWTAHCIVPKQSKGSSLPAATSAAPEVDFRNAYYPSYSPMYWEGQGNTREWTAQRCEVPQCADCENTSRHAAAWQGRRNAREETGPQWEERANSDRDSWAALSGPPMYWFPPDLPSLYGSPESQPNPAVDVPAPYLDGSEALISDERNIFYASNRAQGSSNVLASEDDNIYSAPVYCDCTTCLLKLRETTESERAAFLSILRAGWGLPGQSFNLYHPATMPAAEEREICEGENPPLHGLILSRLIDRQVEHRRMLSIQWQRELLQWQPGEEELA